MIIFFTIVYALYLPLILKFERFRPKIYHIISDEKRKKRWIKNKIISEILIICSLIIFSFNYYLRFSQIVNNIFSSIVCVLFIVAITLNIVSNLKNAGKLVVFK